MIRIGEVILEQRTARGLTQQQVADYLQVTKATVSKWEKGYSYPDITLLPTISAYFGMTIDALLNAKHEMTKEAIRQWYVDFTERFTEEPYEVVLDQLKRDQTLYYNDANFLLQLAILRLNHVELASDQQTTLSEIIHILERVEEITEDVWIKRQANVLIATTALYLQQPDVTLERLSGSLKPIMGEEMLLAEAYEAKGEEIEATKVVQSYLFQQLLGMIGSSTTYLRLIQTDEWAFEETLKRIGAIIEAYDVEQLHPNGTLQFYYAAAQLSAIQQNENRCKKYLMKYVQVITTNLFPVMLTGDHYFTLLDEWFDTLDLGSHALRDPELVRKSIIQSLHHPAFSAYVQQEWFEQLHEQLQKLEEAE